MTKDLTYIGTELSVFSHAVNWKRYYASIIRPYLGKHIVEVGAGIGATTLALCDGSADSWICLEPDSKLRHEIDQLISTHRLPACCRTQDGFVSELAVNANIDTFVYIDVLEHIEDDHAELESAAMRLIPGGRLIVLSPAFNFLYSPFDKAIGHYRRYNKNMLRILKPSECILEKLIYLDSVGMTTSLVNRFLLRQFMPTMHQILFWDSKVIPISRRVDPLVGFSFGRSLLGIWKKDGK